MIIRFLTTNQKQSLKSQCRGSRLTSVVGYPLLNQTFILGLLAK